MNVLRGEARLTIVTFTMLGLAFIASGTYLTLKLREYHNEFYLQHRALLWSATVVLAAPLMFRSIFDLISLDDNFHEFIANKTTEYNALFFIFVQFIPCMT